MLAEHNPLSFALTRHSSLRSVVMVRRLWSWQFARQTAEQTAGQTADASLYAPVELFALKSDTGSISTALYSPDGKFVATAGDGPTARVWDSSTGKKVADLQGHTGAITAVAFSLDGTRVAAAELGFKRNNLASEYRTTFA